MPRAAGVNRDDLGFLLAKAVQRWNEVLTERFRSAGFFEVRASYGSVLVPLLEEDGLRMGELARRSRLSKQTMTTLVRLVERDGLVRREPDPDDARASRVFLTARSEALRPVVEAALLDLEARVAASLTARGLETLKRSLKGVMEL